MTEVHQRPRFANNGIAGAQYRAVSPPLPSGAGRTRSWWGAAGSGEGYRWNCRTSVPGRRGVGGRCCSPAAGVVPTRIKRCGRPRCRVRWRNDHSARRDLRQMGERARRHAGTVHSGNTVDNASPHRNTSRLVSPRVDSTMILERSGPICARRSPYPVVGKALATSTRLASDADTREVGGTPLIKLERRCSPA